MRDDVRTADVDMRLSRFRHDFPLGSAQRVVLVGDRGQYRGIVLLPDVYPSPVEKGDDEHGLGEFIRWRDDFLLPEMNSKQAAGLFDSAESEALAVVNTPSERKVIGLLTESHTLRRYSEEHDLRRREATGELRRSTLGGCKFAGQTPGWNQHRHDQLAQLAPLRRPRFLTPYTDQ